MISPDFLFEKSGKLCDCVLLKVPFSPFPQAFLVCVCGGGGRNSAPPVSWCQMTPIKRPHIWQAVLPQKDKPFTTNSKQNTCQGWGEETKWENGGGNVRIWTRKVCEKFPQVAVRMHDGRLNVTCESCFPSFLFGTDGCLTINREFTRCSLFLLNRYTLFLQNMTCFAAPRFPCSGMMSSAKTWNRRTIIFCSHL